MGTRDISRYMYNPLRHYTSVWQQMGRIVTDFDENDGQSIVSEERRRALVDIIGAYGTPDDGFRIANPRRVDGMIEFDLMAGTLYLGGLRLELETLQTYLGQTDHLQVPQLEAPDGARRDMIIIEAYEAPVTAVEDGELFDPALGGADTAARGRRFQRVHIIPNVGAVDCDQAWNFLIDMLEETANGSIGSDNRNLVDTELTVTYTDEGVDDDLCEPAVGGGYLGAENQAIRVQIVAGNTLTWGYNNASPLYRVSLSADRTRVTLITPPRDEYSTPVVGQVIEILPWGALLPNGEKTASLTGHLTRISEVDPSDETANGAITITLEDAVPTAGFEDWRDRPDADLMEEEGVFYYMQVWNRGSDITSDPAITFTPNVPLTLGTTGIQVTISGDDRPGGDYWIIAARPETPNQVLPWELELGSGPHGYARYVAPLGVIHWRADGTADVTDCRPPFRPLTATDDCCTFMVGDGKTSDGHFNNLNEALERLGSAGGDICLLPGTHIADVALIGRSNITISGCGTRSVLIPEDPEAAATISLFDCTAINLVNFAIVNVAGTGILAQSVGGLTIENVNVLAGEVGIDADDSEDVVIRRCVIRMLDREGGDVGIYAQGDRLTIENSDIQVIEAGDLPEPPEDNDPDTPPVDPTDPCADPKDFYTNGLYLIFYIGIMWSYLSFDKLPKAPYITLGGIQIGSGSEDVLIRENLVSGGAGNGITLGSDIGDIDIFEPPPDVPDVEDEPYMIEHGFDFIRGQLLLDGNPIGSMTIFFEDNAGNALSEPVASDGTFSIKLPPGVYSVYVSDDDYRVIKHEELGEGAYIFHLDRRETPDTRPIGGDDILAFIHDVLIQENKIANMSLSGIGVPSFASSDEAILSEAFKVLRASKADIRLMLMTYLLTGTITGFVVDLVIYRNTIVRCVLDAPELGSDIFAISRAIGGISLALTDGLYIEENVVQECGSDAKRALCGIYGALTIDATVRENYVLHNGADQRARKLTDDLADDVLGRFRRTTPDVDTSDSKTSYYNLRQAKYVKNKSVYDSYRGASALGSFTSVTPTLEVEPGPRGGIVLPICLSANIFMGGQKRLVDDVPQDITTLAKGRHAARVDGNYVVQPFGKALFLAGAGSMSVSDNQLISDRALSLESDSRAGGIMGLLAGNLQADDVNISPSNTLVMNFAPSASSLEAFEILLAVIQKRFDEMVEAGLPSIRYAPSFPDGNVLFVGNQMRQSDAVDRQVIVTLFSLDDVNFSDNQIDVLNGDLVLATSVVLAATARASHNRMKEPVMPALREVMSDNTTLNRGHRYSLVTFNFALGGMIDNHGNYCFKAFGNKLNVSGNLSTLGDFLKCDEETDDIPTQMNLIFALLMFFAGQFTKRMFQDE